MLVQVEVTWTLVQSTGANAFGTYASHGLAFDTESLAVVPYENYYTSGSYQGGPPAEVHTAAGTVLYHTCASDFTKTSYVYDGTGSFTTTTEANSADCGWAAPLTCELGTASVSQDVTPTGPRLTVHFSGTANGQVQYSLDGGAEQPSPVFNAVAAGTRHVQLRDAGLAGCTRTVDVEVLPAASAVAVPTGPAQGVDFVAQPLWYPLTGQPANALVELELYAERAHNAEDFALVLTLRKFTDAAGWVSFRLDTLLLPLLTALVPASSATTQVATQNLVNYFVRATCAGVATLSPLRTALRGGLPAEWQGTDYFSWRTTAFGLPPFLSWQPLGPGAYAAGQAKAITRAQPEWLAWLCPVATPGLRVARAYDQGPGTYALTDYELVGPTPARGWRNQLLLVPLGATRPGFARLSVQLQTAEGQPLSPLAWYTFVEQTPRTRYLLFTNSLGGVDTLRCEGRLEATLEATASSAARPARFGPLAPAADRQMAELTASRKLQLKSGWLEPADLDWLQELVLTREAWHQVAGQLRPLDVAKRSLATYSDEPGLRGLQLDFDYAYAPTAYAPGTY